MPVGNWHPHCKVLAATGVLDSPEIGVSDVPMLHTLTSRARPGWDLMTSSGFL